MSLRLPDDPGQRLFAWAISLAIAVLLLAAAYLKGAEAIQHLALGKLTPIAAVPVSVITILEIGFAIFLLCGKLPNICWWISLLLMSSFSLIALTKSVTGSASCDCFGTLTVSPSLMACVDLSIVYALVVARTLWSNQFRLLWVTSAIGSMLISLSLVLWFALAGPAQQLEGKSIILRPEEWVGNPMPLTAKVDGGRHLESGRWEVLIILPTCGKCRRAIERFCLDTPGRTAERRAIISLGSDLPLTHCNARVMKMPPNATYLANVPIIVSINNGIVTSVENRTN